MRDQASRSDADLIRDCLAGNAEGWKVLVRRYQRLISSITFKFRLEPDDAADVFQSVCLALIQQLPNLRQQTKLSSWIITVAVRECWRLREAEKKTALASVEDQEYMGTLPDTAPPAEEDLIRFEQQFAVRRAVESLTDPCRKLMRLLFYEPDRPTYADISRQLGWPVSSIGPNRARCLAKLKEALAKNGFSFPACISSTDRGHP
jgi:RNA polymerase sigma factor (sigma-70 family)